MAKRVIVRKGNVFCVEIDGKYKCFFQYVCDDLFMLNGQVIQVFKTRYPMEYEPVMEDIVRDKVAFYAHTIVRAGLIYEVWYKVGNAALTVSDDYKKVVWGITNDTKQISGGIHDIPVNPIDNWTLWRTNKMPFLVGGKLPDSYRNIVEDGAIVPYVEIVSRIKLGYYTYELDEYEKLKRIPHADVDSYTKSDKGNCIVYSHFKGESVIEEIVEFLDGTVKISDGISLNRPKFWETNWKHKEFISGEEFNEVMSKYDGSFV